MRGPRFNGRARAESVMRVPRLGAMHLAALLVAQVLCLTPSHSQAPARFGQEVSKQQDIYRSTGNDTPGGYVVTRGLSDYADVLAPEFKRQLANLGSRDRWLDIGAGEGQAILDYYTLDYDLAHAKGSEQPVRKAQSVAISIEDRRTPLWRQKASSLEANQIQYFFDKPLRGYSRAELGRFQIITDVIGGFSYTDNLSLFMEKVLGFLELNGSFHTVLQDVHSETGKNLPHYPGSPYLTEIRQSDGSELKVCSWLKSISCVQVTCELKSGWKPLIEVFHVKKVCDNPVIPSLTPVHYQAGTPPERGFQLRD
jgi:hypothetical protein